MKHWRDVLPGRMIEVFFEDLVTDTQGVGKRLINHLGLEWDNRWTEDQSEMEAIRNEAVGRWKHYDKQLQPIIKTMGSIVDEYEQERAEALK